MWDRRSISQEPQVAVKAGRNVQAHDHRDDQPRPRLGRRRHLPQPGEEKPDEILARP